MVQQHGLDTVNTACELALAQGTGHHLSTIVNIVHRLAEPQLNRPGNSGDPLVCIWTPPFMQQYMY